MIDAPLVLKTYLGTPGSRQQFVQAGYVHPLTNVTYLHLYICPSRLSCADSGMQGQLSYENSTYSGNTSLTIKPEEMLDVLALIQLNARMPVQSYLSAVRTLAAHRKNFKNSREWKDYDSSEQQVKPKTRKK